MLIDYKRGQGSITFTVKILDSSATTGAGLTGLTFESAGLIIAARADNEETTTTYTQAAGHIQTIAKLGEYAAPDADNCRFKQLDSTNHPGVYEIQLADARFAVTSAKSLLVSISGATNCAETDCVIPLRDVDLYDSVRAGLTALPAAAADDPGGLLAAVSLVNTTIATLASQTSFTLTAGSTDDDAYNDCAVIVTDASTGVQKCEGLIEDYTGESKTVTLYADPGVFDMGADDKITIKPSVGTMLLAMEIDGETVETILKIGRAFAAGDVVRSGNRYTYKDAEGESLFAFTIDSSGRTSA